jgi:hypothetical protein
METNESNKSILDELKRPPAPFISGVVISIAIAILATFTLILLFNNNKIPKTNTSDGTSQEDKLKITGNVFIIVFLLVILGFTAFLLLPASSNILGFVNQIQNVFYVVLYTIFLIVFIRYLDTDYKSFMDKYAKIILPVTILLTSVIFIKGLSQNYVEKFNLIYERIKNVILLFCFIVIMIVYYNIDPGGLIKQNFGYSLLLTIILAVFGFLYLIISFTIPKFGQSDVETEIPVLNNFTFYGGIGFIIFVVLTSLLFNYSPGTNSDPYGLALVLFILTCVVWVTALIISFYMDEKIMKKVDISRFDLGRKSLMYLFGFVISALLIGWLTYNLQNMSSDSGMVSFILNMLLVIIILMLIYRTVFAKMPGPINNKKNSFVELIMNLLLYIPCIFSVGFDNIISLGKGVTKDAERDKGSFALLLVALALIASLFIYPKVNTKIATQGGRQLINQPINTNIETMLSSYEELNGSVDPDYKYAISCWIYIDSAPPNTNPNYSKYTSILNYGNKPNIMYNAEKNSLKIIMHQQDYKEKGTNKLIDFDENGNRVIYVDSNYLLQKWNNIIINYNGGTLDIFVNKQLVKSAIGVVPYMTNDSLTVGENNGINGGICNLVYFKNPLTINQIYFIYNMVKDKTPPVTPDNYKTIISQY